MGTIIFSCNSSRLRKGAMSSIGAVTISPLANRRELARCEALFQIKHYFADHGPSCRQRRGNLRFQFVVG